ncbi:HNH endonuclease [Clostridium beijerinckii]|uniref:HNH endonuclease 5 domain-containing protein n=1 Tax=Clostridium beijerinckii TaxID=1520 RepID=A0AAX0B2N6_CLOBE|nr:HNH endonuclease [Clostridium beijerinckii]NRT89473.1 hypothetical protein [Clostridium beijerinckii]NYC74929.1 hypothetical protein [Clostridium beijerinckii]
MRCLFCKKISTGSTSVEHIVPESLGNKSHTLRPGIVCDTCNNYFARKVERPFLEHESIEMLRFKQSVESKKGKVPPAKGLLNFKYPVTARKYTKGGLAGTVEVATDEALEEIMNRKDSMIIFPDEVPLPSGSIVSRFLAKVALEVLAQRLANHPDGLEYLVDEEQFDLIRNHARKGETAEWPFHVRQIYDENKSWLSKNGQSIQLMFEYDILVTKENEWYFVLVLFGTEFTINYGAPEIEGYLSWLKENDNESPLYKGKNAEKMNNIPDINE